MTTQTAHALNPGEHLGHYEILRELGRGGMATVYLAHDRKHDRPVALKVLHPQLAATLGPERFLREILTTARLTHPHILPLHDSGNANGLLYYVMPFVQGESLRQRLARSGGLPVRDALTILREVTSALAYAHHHGVIHRDIKPENILLSEESALVADFGIAKAVSAAADSSSNGTSGTATGLVLGTPAYMAPEQAAADPHLDHRADLYALGCVLYEMVSGRPPFERPSRQAMMAAHAAETPVPVLSLRPDLPPALADLTMRLLARNPADRPDSASSVLAALEDVPAQARPATTPSIRRSFPVRWPLWLGAGAVVVFAAGVLVAILAPRKKPARLDSRVVAIAPFRVSSVDSSLAYLRKEWSISWPRS